jgi:hypothetical protein
MKEGLFFRKISFCSLILYIIMYLYFTSGDESECASDGWRNHDGYFDSGDYHYGPVQVSLTLDVDPSAETYTDVEFEFRLFLKPGSLFKFYVGGGPIQVFNSSQNGKWITKRLEVYYGDKNVSWVFCKGCLSLILFIVFSRFCLFFDFVL